MLEDGATLFLFAADASYSEQLLIDGVADGVSPDPAVARATLARIQRLVTERPTIYLPTHDPAAVVRLTRRQVVSQPPTQAPA